MTVGLELGRQPRESAVGTAPGPVNQDDGIGVLPSGFAVPVVRARGTPVGFLLTDVPRLLCGDGIRGTRCLFGGPLGYLKVINLICGGVGRAGSVRDVPGGRRAGGPRYRRRKRCSGNDKRSTYSEDTDSCPCCRNSISCVLM